jgi:hypothetical protein
MAPGVGESCLPAAGCPLNGGRVQGRAAVWRAPRRPRGAGGARRVSVVESPRVGAPMRPLPMDGEWGAAGQCRRVAPRGRADATVTNRWGVTAQVCCALQRSHRRPVPDQSQDS